MLKRTFYSKFVLLYLSVTLSIVNFSKSCHLSHCIHQCLLTTSPQLIDIYADIGWIKVKMYRYSHGNSLGNMTFVWRVPSEDHTSTARTIAVLNSKQQLFCTRQMRRDFISRYIGLECQKPQCVYAAGTLTFEEKRVLKLVITSQAYSCGCQLFPSGSPFHTTIVCQQAMSCNDLMETQYYSSSCISFPSVCWFCTMPEETLVNDDFIQNLRCEYAIVRPICFLCRSNGNMGGIEHQTSETLNCTITMPHYYMNFLFCFVLSFGYFFVLSLLLTS